MLVFLLSTFMDKKYTKSSLAQVPYSLAGIQRFWLIPPKLKTIKN